MLLIYPKVSASLIFPQIQARFGAITSDYQMLNGKDFYTLFLIVVACQSPMLLHHLVCTMSSVLTVAGSPPKEVPKQLLLLHEIEVQSPGYMVCILKSAICMVLQTAYRLNDGSY